MRHHRCTMQRFCVDDSNSSVGGSFVAYVHIVLDSTYEQDSARLHLDGFWIPFLLTFETQSDFTDILTSIFKLRDYDSRTQNNEFRNWGVSFHHDDQLLGTAVSVVRATRYAEWFRGNVNRAFYCCKVTLSSW